MSTFWATLMANAGWNPKTMVNLNNLPFKITLFTSLLGAHVVWCGYRASITSALSAVRVVYPFNSLESLTKTSYM